MQDTRVLKDFGTIYSKTTSTNEKAGIKGKAPLFLFFFCSRWRDFQRNMTERIDEKKCSIKSRYDCDLMSTGRKEIVETFQSEVSLLTIGGKIAKT